MELRRRNNKGVSDANYRPRVCVVPTSGEDAKNTSCKNGNETLSANGSGEDAVVGAAVRGGSLLMLLAIFQRSSTFVLNLLLQRAMLSSGDRNIDSDDESVTASTSALEEYGAAAITLELISSTALFLAREPFRVALARSFAPLEVAGATSVEISAADLVAKSRARREAYRRQFVNTAWLSAPIGIFLSAIVWSVYPRIIRNDAFYGIKENRQAAMLVCIAAAVELMCEPMVLIFQHQLKVGVRVRAETAAVLVLGMSRYLLVAWANMGVLSFGYAQLLHSVTLAAAYLFSAASQVVNGFAADAENMKRREAEEVETNSAMAQRAPEGRGDVSVQESQIGDAVTAKRGEGGSNPSFTQIREWLPGRPVAASDLSTRVVDGVSIDDAIHGDGASARKEREGNNDQHTWIHQRQLRLVGAIAGHSVLKHVLTEGDKIVLARASSAFSTDVCRSSSASSGVSPTADNDGVCLGGNGTAGRGSLYEQGVYAVASGYGSLAARLLFQPLEEAARLMFSKLGAEDDELKNQEHHHLERKCAHTDGHMVDLTYEKSAGRVVVSPLPIGNAEAEDMRDQVTGAGEKLRRPSGDIHTSASVKQSDIEHVRRRLRSRMADLLAILLKLVLTAGLVFVCFGFHYTETLLRLLLANRGTTRSNTDDTVSQVATVLSWYCVYVLFLAANGMCEAFSCAVARGRQLTGMGAGLLASFVAFWALVGPLTGRFRTRGLVMANAAGMACRVICSVVFIRRFFLHEGRSTREGTPDAIQRQPGQPREEIEDKTRKNLWRRVTVGALPHPAVIVTLAISSVAILVTSPYNRYSSILSNDWEREADATNIPWDVSAAAKHVAVGTASFVVSACAFVSFERKFLAELRALWASRRR